VVSKPVLQAILLADYVYTDQLTQKKVIAGTFNQIQFSEFPASVSVCVYAAITNLQGDFTVTFRYSDLDTNEALLTLAGSSTIRSDDRLAVFEFVCYVPQMPAPHPGLYAMELLVDGELVGQSRIRVQGPSFGPPPASEEGHE
jgi:hypothetical protein